LESLTYNESEKILTELADAVEKSLVGERENAVPDCQPEPRARQRASPQADSAKELLQLIEKESNPENRGLAEILDSSREPGQTFFFGSLRHSGSPYKIKSRLFREAVEELVSGGWLYPPESTGKMRLYEFKTPS
jgi:hypothetical protein